jgi:hypothetical protein
MVTTGAVVPAMVAFVVPLGLGAGITNAAGTPGLAGVDAEDAEADRDQDGAADEAHVVLHRPASSGARPAVNARLHY